MPETKTEHEQGIRFRDQAGIGWTGLLSLPGASGGDWQLECGTAEFERGHASRVARQIEAMPWLQLRGEAGA